jgi:GNAT superfamily N-acetyltransferase
MFVIADRDHSARYATVKPNFGEAMVVARLAEMAGKPIDWYVWLQAAQPVGWVMIYWAGKPTLAGVPDLADLFVAPVYRGQGIGTAMLHACEELARARGFAQISLAVNPDDNPRALALYLRLGYRPTGGPKYLDGVYDDYEDWVIDLVKDVNQDMNQDGVQEVGPP